MAGNGSVVGPLAGRSPALLLAAGAVFLVTAANTGLVFLVDGYDLTIVTTTLLSVALLCAVLGVVGLYPALADEVPRLAGASVVVAGLATLNVLALGGWGLAEAASLTGPVSPVVALTTPLLLIAAFGLTGIAVLRTDAYPPVAGVCLLAESGALLALIAIPIVVFAGEAPLWGAALLEGIQGAILLAAGRSLQGSGSPGDPGEAAMPDRTAT